MHIGSTLVLFLKEFHNLFPFHIIDVLVVFVLVWVVIYWKKAISNFCTS